MVKGFSSCPGGSKKGMTQVCVTELFLETRQDATGGHFPNWGYWDKTSVFWSRCPRKSRKNSGKIWDGTGLLSTTRESLECSRNVFKLCFNYNFFKSNMTNKVLPLQWSQSIHFMKTTSTETDKEPSMQITDLL